MTWSLQRKNACILLLLVGMITASACAQPPADQSNDQAERARPTDVPTPDVIENAPPAPVVIDPPTPPQPHPLAPESLPNKPPTIPEEMPDGGRSDGSP
jgi:hypothetical protein